MSATSPTLLTGVSMRRRQTDRVMRGLLAAGMLIAIVPLALVLFYVISKGARAWSWHFFSTDPTGAYFGDPGGIRSGLIGSLLIVGLASLIAIPIGIGVALWLVEYGKQTWFANVVRYFVDVMTGVPSIVFGLFIYITLVTSHVGGSGFAAWKGSIAIALLMLPIVVRSSEVVLQLVPESLREAALALGAPRWRVVSRIVLPTAVPGLVTGSLLSVARGLGETAPLLFTAAIANGLSGNLNAQMNSLPYLIYNNATSPQAKLVAIGWGAALTLVVLILILNILARVIARRSRLA
jgi:phosphate transport system permease protein